MAAGDWKEMLYAAQNGDLELVKYHIRMGEDPNYQHPEFMTTPLIESVRFGHIKVVAYLLQHGADPSIRADFGGETALSVAKTGKKHEIVRLLEGLVL